MRQKAARTRHLLAIGLDAVGVPISLFTVNRWVTGDQLLSSASSLRLLAATATLDTGRGPIDRLLAGLVGLYLPQIRTLFRERGQRLVARARRGAGTLDDESLEVLSELRVDLDRRIAAATRPARRRRGDAGATLRGAPRHVAAGQWINR